jgi:hypothetical protein
MKVGVLAYFYDRIATIVPTPKNSSVTFSLYYECATLSLVERVTIRNKSIWNVNRALFLRFFAVAQNDTVVGADFVIAHRYIRDSSTGLLRAVASNGAEWHRRVAVCALYVILNVVKNLGVAVGVMWNCLKELQTISPPVGVAVISTGVEKSLIKR